MQNTWHIVAFYDHMTAEVMSGRVHYAKLPKFTRAHDAYLRELAVARAIDQSEEQYQRGIDRIAQNWNR